MSLRRYFLIVALLLASQSLSVADTLISTQWMFSGRNVYSPNVMYDNGVYKMWYGGWQTQADYPNDKIFYRTSTDNVNWSAPITVLTRTAIGSNVVDVNDPSVTKHFNTGNGQWQYTMFYTICVDTCSQADNQVWSSTGPDGIHWYNHLMLLAGSLGPSDPSAILESGPNGGFWKVYFDDRLDHGKIKMVSVNGNRNVVPGSEILVYRFPATVGINTIANAEVKLVNGTWQLFFNAYFGGSRSDIYKVESTSNTSWPSTYEGLMQNTGPTWCATQTPGVLPVPGVLTQYDLYYALIPRSPNGTCDFGNNQSIQRWRWQDTD